MSNVHHLPGSTGGTMAAWFEAWLTGEVAFDDLPGPVGRMVVERARLAIQTYRQALMAAPESV